MTLSREQLLEKTGSELIDIYNDLGPNDPITATKWSKAKTVLVDMIFEQGYGKPTRTIREAALDLLCKAVYYEDKTKNPHKDNVVSADHKNARSVGIPYLEIIDLIREEFPGAETSAACLRWYAVKVRAGEFGYENYRLVQRRPRARPVR